MGVLRQISELKKLRWLRPSKPFVLLVTVLLIAAGITALTLSPPMTGLVPWTARALGYSVEAYRIDDARLLVATFAVALVLSAGLTLLVHIVAGRTLRRIRR